MFCYWSFISLTTKACAINGIKGMFLDGIGKADVSSNFFITSPYVKPYHVHIVIGFLDRQCDVTDIFYEKVPLMFTVR